MQRLTRHSKKLTGRMWTIIALLFVGLLLETGGAWFLPYWMPTAIVYAPNFGKPADSLHKVTSAQLAAWDISPANSSSGALHRREALSWWSMVFTIRKVQCAG